MHVGCDPHDLVQTPRMDVEGRGKLAVVGSGACGAFEGTFEGRASVETSAVGRSIYKERKRRISARIYLFIG